MFDVGSPAPDATVMVEAVSTVFGATRVAAFDLSIGAGVPETDPRPVLLVAQTALTLDIGGSGSEARVEIAPGQSLVLPNGIAGIANVGSERARFILIGLPTISAQTPREPGLHHAHQALDAVQAALEALRKDIAPYTAGTIGSIREHEACPDASPKRLIAPGPCADRTCQPGMEATPRDTERLAHPQDRPDPPVLRDEPEHHSGSLAK